MLWQTGGHAREDWHHPTKAHGMSMNCLEKNDYNKLSKYVYKIKLDDVVKQQQRTGIDETTHFNILQKLMQRCTGRPKTRQRHRWL